LPIDLLRRELQSELVALRYSPLSLDFVEQDRGAGELPAGRARRAGRAADVHHRMGRHALGHATRALIIDADIYLLDAAAPQTDRALWGGHVTRTLEMGARATRPRRPRP
jgi:hypothetical protein